MKYTITLIFLIALYSNSFSQTLDEKEIHGKWNVQEIIKKPSNPQFAPLIDGFKNSTFIFNQNGIFELKTTSKSELFVMITDMTNGTKWKLERDKQFVKIGNEDDRYSIMGIAISEVNGKKIFYLEESGITLEMKKTE